MDIQGSHSSGAPQCIGAPSPHQGSLSKTGRRLPLPCRCACMIAPLFVEAIMHKTMLGSQVYNSQKKAGRTPAYMHDREKARLLEPSRRARYPRRLTSPLLKLKLRQLPG